MVTMLVVAQPRTLPTSRIRPAAKTQSFWAEAAPRPNGSPLLDIMTPSHPWRDKKIAKIKKIGKRQKSIRRDLRN
jgi:hypothetical protein